MNPSFKQKFRSALKVASTSAAICSFVTGFIWVFPKFSWFFLLTLWLYFLPWFLLILGTYAVVVSACCSGKRVLCDVCVSLVVAFGFIPMSCFLCSLSSLAQFPGIDMLQETPRSSLVILSFGIISVSTISPFLWRIQGEIFPHSSRLRVALLVVAMLLLVVLYLLFGPIPSSFFWNPD